MNYRVIYRQAGYDFISSVYHSRESAEWLERHLRKLMSVTRVEIIPVGEYA